MDRRFTVYRRVSTSLDAERVFSEVEHSLRVTVGGTIQKSGNTLLVTNGTNNLNFAFVGDVSAVITLTQPSPGMVEMNGAIVFAPNALFWISAVAGFFCLWFLWGFNLLFFVVDPRSNYQTALDRVDLSPGQTPSFGN